MAFVIAQPSVPVLPVAGGEDVFPVRRIYCVGRNYAAHAREMGSDPDREPPFFFCKPADAVVPIPSGECVAWPYAMATANLHHEVELVVAIGRGGERIAVEQALSHVWGYAVGLDMTRRDLQGQMKDQGRPWEIGKAFDRSAPMSPLLPAAAVGHPGRGAVWLDVNGVRRQQGDLADMIWSVAEVISRLSGWFRLEPGDLVMTGTPEGVGAVKVGDRIEAGVEGVGKLSLQVT
ncbi:fumarylacetoacetate hydrolase family protein [Zoogloea sp.]|uniref:fumarylacetoacetate hydrolase family protein n=1 Tax=Zoogloea sp. TaxID=49181 RepID=UPI001415C9CF|nr:MAG: fumarylacetoacetate hydrolase family protein [Zoogloea sp.]